MSSSAAPPEAAPRWSIGRRVTVWSASSALLLILLTASLLYHSLGLLLVEQADRYLAEKIAVVQKLVEQEPLDVPEVREEVELEAHAVTWLRVVDSNHRVITHTPGWPAITIDEATLEPATATDADGAPYRVLTVRARTHQAGATSTWLVQAAVSFTHEADLLASYRRRLLIVLLCAALASLPLGLVTARRALASIQEVSSHVEGTSPVTLHRRLALSGLPDELLPLAGAFNDLQDRLRGSFDRLGNFSSNIAHELRSPLANLRGGMEIALTRQRSSEEYREVIASALEECELLGDVVESLLFLARAESTQEPLARQPFPVIEELERVRDYFSATAQERGIALEVDADPSAIGNLDTALFNRAVANLVSNALNAISGSGGRVSIAARADASGGLVVTIRDTGCGIPPEDLGRIFDRFYRVGADRSRRTGGVGLGLSIVQSIVQLHGGTVAIESEPGRGTTVTLRFPGMPD